jgi:Spy/CpxP family protein refolding chaperone
MLGFLIGTICLFGLVKVLRGGCGHRRHGWGGGCGHRRHGWGGGCGRRGRGRGGSGWRGRHGGEDGGHDEHDGEGSGGGFGRRFWLRQMFERLDTTPGQEKAISAAFDEVRDSMKEARKDWKRARGDVATALRSELLDEVALREASTKLDVAGQQLRDAMTGAVTKIHAVLDQQQRVALADFIDAGAMPFGRRGEGPYRTWA